MTDPVIRPATADDVEASVRVWESARWDAKQPHMRARVADDRDTDLTHFRDVVMIENEVWVACLGDQVVGLLAMAGDRVNQLHVHEAHQRSGVGTALMDQAKGRAPGGLTLSTFQANERSRAFYERGGFVPIAFGVSPHPEDEPDVTYRWEP